MSYVTDVVLLTAVGHDAGIRSVQKWLRSEGWGELKAVDEYCGGNKAFQASLYAAAYNHFHENGFIEAVKNAPWDYYEGVMLLIQRENDDGFTVVYDGGRNETK